MGTATLISENVLDAWVYHDQVVPIVRDAEGRNLLEDKNWALSAPIRLYSLLAVSMERALYLIPVQVF